MDVRGVESHFQAALLHDFYILGSLFNIVINSYRAIISQLHKITVTHHTDKQSNFVITLPDL